MAYCTSDDILLRISFKNLKEITNDDNASTTIQMDKVSAAIDDACGLIDSKIFTRFDVPLAVVPVRIKRIAIDIAIYYIYKLRYDTKLPEQIDKTYQEAVVFLDALRDGVEELIGVEYKTDNEFVFLTDDSEYDGSTTIEEIAKL